MRDRSGQPPADPYRGSVGTTTYKRTSRFARASLALSNVGLLLVTLVLPATCGAMVDEVPLLVAAITYAIGVVLLFAPALARARLGRSDHLAPEPGLTKTPSNPDDVMVGGLRFMLVGFCGFVLIAAFAMLSARW